MNMYSRFLIFFTAVILVGAGCVQNGKIFASSGSGVNAPLVQPRVIATGVRGVVLVGPSCPVQKMPPDPKCAPHPLESALVVSVDGKEVAQGTSGADGRFSFALAPGEYHIAPAKNAAIFPRVASRDFVVTHAGFTEVTLEADSGIR